MRKFKLLLFTLFLTGCYNYKELNNLNIVSGITIEQNNSSIVINLLIKNSKEESFIVSEEGNNVENIIYKINNQSNKNIYLDHINFIIINKSFAENNINQLVDFIVNRLSKSTSLDIYLTENKGIDILEILNNKGVNSISNYLNNINSSKGFKEIIFDNKYNNFIKDYVEDGINPIIGILNIDNDSLMINKGAILKNDNNIVLISKAEYDMFMLLKRKSKQISVDLICGDKNVSFTLENIKINYSIDYSASPLSIKFNVSLDYHSIDNLCMNFDINSLSEKTLHDEINKSIRNLQKKYNSDIIGFGYYIKKNNPKYWNKIKNDWFSKIYPKINININTKIKTIY
ncbi:MAG TPA: Ger(x)C family spore germination protein [Tenericutes bacterium]|nr:Ger(x)C family spore germination protein [Mycoplasmatota bacterium]